MPSSLTIRQVCSRRPKAGQLEDFFRVLAFLGVAVGNFCRPTAIFAKIGVANIRAAIRLDAHAIFAP